MSETESRLSELLHDAVSTQPFTPDPVLIERRGRQLRRSTMLVRAGAGVATVAAFAVGASAIPLPGVNTNRPVAAPVDAPLIQLVNYISTSAPRQSGDATLQLRTTVTKGRSVTFADLYTDSGKYYGATTVKGLPAQIAGKRDKSDGLFQREVAAAVEAATGDVATARHHMVNSANPTQVVDSPDSDPRQKVREKETGAVIVDNYLWSHSIDAITAGAGNRQVRAGVLRILSTMPEIKVTHTTTEGQATLTLTAGAPVLPHHGEESLTITADTGMPVNFHSGDRGQKPWVVVTYQNSRVKLADIAAGKL